uniref:ATP synthase complex subunit 8 n=1 Tax=Melolontha hippocastani TaxID=903833 RepID=A0A343C391_9SCAR|nr:ATP synthase F0 subunit 8 [Melolontha hippocastani]
MPQMAPLNWLSLFVLFSLIMLLFNSMNYFMVMYPTKIYQIKKLTKSITWKW